MRHPNPLVNFRPLLDRNFGACCPHNFLRVCGSLWFQHFVACPASVVAWLQCAASGARLVTGRHFCRAYAAGRRLCAGPAADARWVILAGVLTMAAGSYWLSQLNIDIGPGQVVFAQSRAGSGIVYMFCPRKCRRLSVHPGDVARRCRWLAKSTSERRRERGHLARPSLAGSPRAIPHPSAR